MNLILIILGALVVLAIIALVLAPDIRERFRRDNSPTTTAKPKPAQPVQAVAARSHSHRAGAR